MARPRSTTQQVELWPRAAADETRAMRDAVYARECLMLGRCSGFPECCIAAFIDVVVYRRGAWPPDPLGADVGYRRCPACIASDHRVVPRRCGQWCECYMLCATSQATLPVHRQLAWLEVAERTLVLPRLVPQ